MYNAKKEKRNKFTEAEKMEYARKYIVSNKSKIEMSKEIGINTRTLSDWLKRYDVQKDSKEKEEPSFIEIAVKPASIIDRKDIIKQIQIQIGNVKLEMTEEYEIEKMIKIIRAVVEIC